MYSKFIDEVNSSNEINLTSFTIFKDNCVLVEIGEKEKPQHLHSVTKSVTSLGVGIAVDLGILSLNDRLVSFFSDKLPLKISDNLKKVTVEHLLTMTSGIDKNYFKLGCQHDDWVKAFLALNFVYEPGTHYLYNTMVSHMLSAILQKVTGESLVEFLYKHMFCPLDIPKPDWKTCPLGITWGGDGLWLSPESMCKIGKLLLNMGEYEGKRIISEKYLKAATSAMVVKQNKIGKDKYSGHHYGYQFHVGLGGCYRAHGTYGQLIFVSPKDKLIAVATSSDTKTEKLLELIYTMLLNNEE